MWRSVFLHEFVDRRIRNFQAVPGRPTPESLALAPEPDAATGINSVRFTPGRGFEYVLAEPLQRVIGLSCRVRLCYPPAPHGQLFSVIGLGGAAGFELWPLAHPQPGQQATRANALLRIGAPHVNLGTVEVGTRTFTDLRFDWHTSGQARLSADGRLVAYHNAVAPGAQFDIDRVVFGQPGGQPAAFPAYLVARVFVRVLLRTDSAALFTRLLPVVEVGEDVGRCRLRTFNNLLRMLDRLREFMSAFHQSTSRPWTREGGPAEGPFDPESVRAHELAVAAVLELARMLRAGDFSAPEKFLDPFTEFLRILRAAQPARFDALAAEIDAAKIVPEGCREVFDRQLGENAQALDPVIRLLTAASERVRAVPAGSGPDYPGGY